MNKIEICYRFTKYRRVTRHVDKKSTHGSSISIASYYVTMRYLTKQRLLRVIRDRSRPLQLIRFAHLIFSFRHRIIRLSFLHSSNSRQYLVGFAGHSRRVFSRKVTVSRVLPISLCAPEGWRRLIVLEKFNFDDADGRPNSERRIGIQAKDLTYHSPLSRTSPRPKLPDHGNDDRYTRVPRSSPFRASSRISKLSHRFFSIAITCQAVVTILIQGIRHLRAD